MENNRFEIPVTVKSSTAGATQLVRSAKEASDYLLTGWTGKRSQKHRVALQAWAEAARDPEIMAIYQREGGRGRAAWATYVERAIAAGHLPSDANPVRTAHTLIGLIPGFMVQRLFFEDLTPASYAAGLADLTGDCSQTP